MRNKEIRHGSQLQRHWNKEYERLTTPFDIEEPEKWIAVLEKNGKIHGHVLDSGCGPGRNARYLANLGYSVLGVDFSLNAIIRAKRKAAENGNTALFLCANMCELAGYERHFDTVIDVGCFHSLCENDRAPYAAALHRVCRAGAVVYLQAFSRFDANIDVHLRGKVFFTLSEEQIRTTFVSNGWVVKGLVEKDARIRLTDTKENEKSKIAFWYVKMQYV